MQRLSSRTAAAVAAAAVGREEILAAMRKAEGIVTDACALLWGPYGTTPEEVRRKAADRRWFDRRVSSIVGLREELDEAYPVGRKAVGAGRRRS